MKITLQKSEIAYNVEIDSIIIFSDAEYLVNEIHGSEGMIFAHSIERYTEDNIDWFREIDPACLSVSDIQANADVIATHY